MNVLENLNSFSGCRMIFSNNFFVCFVFGITEEAPAQPQIIVVPVPVPVFVPVPLHLYTQYTPVPLGMPIPVSYAAVHYRRHWFAGLFCIQHTQHCVTGCWVWSCKWYLESLKPFPSLLHRISLNIVTQNYQIVGRLQSCPLWSYF